jgi:hypothetical protein
MLFARKKGEMNLQISTEMRGWWFRLLVKDTEKIGLAFQDWIPRPTYCDPDTWKYKRPLHLASL